MHTLTHAQDGKVLNPVESALYPFKNPWAGENKRINRVFREEASKAALQRQKQRQALLDLMNGVDAARKQPEGRAGKAFLPY